MNISPVPSETPTHWPVFGTRYPKSEIQYFTQVLILIVVIIGSLVNLTIYKDGSDSSLWISLLCSSVGVLLPAPTLRKQVSG